MAEGPDLKSAQYRFESDGGDMAKRKTKTVDAPTYVAGEEKLVMFGWCLTGHHSGCILKFPGHICACECHEEALNERKAEHT